jgi:glycine/D-amino acid oxidase-like deaminating enzyme
LAAGDVVVIGGGLIGLLIAAELVDRGAQVTILEKDHLGFEQSGRSVAAVNLPGGTSRGDPSSMLRVSADQWATFNERWDCDILLNSEGWHIVIADEHDAEWVSVDRATWRETAGYADSETLDAAAARARFPQMQGPFEALDVRPGGHVDAVSVIAALSAVAKRRGVDVRCGTLATGFEVSGAEVTAVKTDRGPVSCGSVIVAAGLWSPNLCDLLGFHIPMQRVRAPAAETEPCPPNTIPGFLRASTFGARQNNDGSIRITGGYRYSAMLHDVSFHDLRDLRIWAPAIWKNRKDVSFRVSKKVIAGEVESAWRRWRTGRNGSTFVPKGYDPSSSPRDRQTQLNHLGDLIPAVRGARIRRAFAGVMDLIPDLQPVLGVVPGWHNAYVAGGFSGHGYMYGPGACKAIAALVAEGDAGVDITPYRPERLAEKLSMRDQMF